LDLPEMKPTSFWLLQTRRRGEVDDPKSACMQNISNLERESEPDVIAVIATLLNGVRQSAGILQAESRVRKSEAAKNETVSARRSRISSPKVRMVDGSRVVECEAFIPEMDCRIQHCFPGSGDSLDVIAGRGCRSRNR